LIGSKALVRDGLVGVVLTGAVWALFTHVLQINLL